MKLLAAILACFFFMGCQSAREEEPRLELISDHPALNEEERRDILTIEIQLLLEELERSKTYRLETDEEYERRTKGKKALE